MHIPESEIRKANFTVLQNSSLVAPYMDEHINIVRYENIGKSEAWITEASPHKRELKCDTKHQSQEADATFITSDGLKPHKPWRTLDTDNDNK